jgi:zinc transporter 9
MSVLPGGKRENQQLRDYCHTRAAAQATLERTEIIVEELALTIKQRLPRVHHVTLEVEGIATTPVPHKG